MPPKVDPYWAWLWEVFSLEERRVYHARAKLGQAGIACPTFFMAMAFSRGVLDADRDRSRAHLPDDHDDQILDRDCPGEYHACRS